MRSALALASVAFLALLAPPASADCPIDCVQYVVDPTLPSEECGDCVGADGFAALLSPCFGCQMHYVVFDAQHKSGSTTVDVWYCRGYEAIVCDYRTVTV